MRTALALSTSRSWLPFVRLPSTYRFVPMPAHTERVKRLTQTILRQVF